MHKILVTIIAVMAMSFYAHAQRHTPRLLPQTKHIKKLPRSEQRTRQRTHRLNMKTRKPYHKIQPPLNPVPETTSTDK